MDAFLQAQYLILSVFVLVLGGLAIFVYTVLKREQEFQKKEEVTFNKYRDILDQARVQAKDLLESTSTTSAKILDETKTTSEHLEVNLDRALHNIAQKHIEKLNTDADAFEKDYDQKLAQFQQQFDLVGQEIIESAKAAMSTTLEQTTHTLMTKSVQSQDEIDQKIRTRTAQMEEEVEDYKKEKLAKVDEEIASLVQKTYQEVLKKSIPESAQKKLIIEMLEKAKKEGVFTL